MALTLENFYLSIADATTLHKAFPSGTTQTVSPGNFQFQCNLTTPLAFVLGNTAFSVSPLDYIGALQTTDTNGTTWCSSNIIGVAGFNVTQWSLGTGFLRNVYPILFRRLTTRFTLCWTIPITHSNSLLLSERRTLEMGLFEARWSRTECGMILVCYAETRG
jgi:hypothetical protein